MGAQGQPRTTWPTLPWLYVFIFICQVDGMSGSNNIPLILLPRSLTFVFAVDFKIKHGYLVKQGLCQCSIV